MPARGNEYPVQDDESKYIGVRAGVGGWARRAAALPATEIMWFFGQNAHDSGKHTWKKKKQKNLGLGLVVGVISKTRKSFWLVTFIRTFSFNNF